MKNLIAIERVERRIYLLRGRKIMLSGDLAALYEVPPKVLIQAVKRHKNRFPSDFMFQLTKAEFENLKSQIVTSSWGGLRRAMPYAFTEHGVAMLSGVLRSPKAIAVNIAIIRAFIRLRKILFSRKDLARRLETAEKRLLDHDVRLGVQAREIKAVLDALHRLMEPPNPPPEPPEDPPKAVIGFRP